MATKPPTRKDCLLQVLFNPATMDCRAKRVEDETVRLPGCSASDVHIPWIFAVEQTQQIADVACHGNQGPTSGSPADLFWWGCPMRVEEEFDLGDRGTTQKPSQNPSPWSLFFSCRYENPHLFHGFEPWMWVKPRPDTPSVDQLQDELSKNMSLPFLTKVMRWRKT